MAAATASNTPPRLLVIEDNADDVDLIRLQLAEAAPEAPFRIESVDRLATALKKLRGADVVLLDLGLPDSRGIDGVTRIVTEAPELPVVVLTGRDDRELGLRAVREGAQDFLVKGRVDGHVLDRSLRYAIERKRAEAALARLATVMGAICYDCGRKVAAEGQSRSYES